MYAGSRLAKYGDIIAVKTGLGRIWVGAVLLATVTSLPELATGISSVAVIGSPNLTMGDLFGSSLFNLMAIAFIDVVYRSGPVLRIVNTGVILTAAAGTLLIATAGSFILLSQTFHQFGVNTIGIYSPLLLCIFLVMQYLLTRFARKQSKQELAEGENYRHLSNLKVYAVFVISAIVVAGCGFWLALIGDGIVEVTGIRASVVGTLFLAIATSSPEIVVSISALRLKSPDLAVSNLVGSNLFNMGVVIFIDDVFYGKGPILSYVGMDLVFSSFIAVVMGCVVIMTLIYRPSGSWRRIWFGIDAIILFVIFVCAYIVLFNFGSAAGLP